MPQNNWQTYQGVNVFRSRVKPALLVLIASGALCALPVAAQVNTESPALTHSLLEPGNTGFVVTREDIPTPFSTDTPNNLNIGIGFSPAKGLDLRADAWRVDAQQQMPAAAVMPEGLIPAAGSGLAPGLAMEDSNFSLSLLEAPTVKSTFSPGQQGNGIDLSASYMWESERFGQFIVSTKATYLYNTTTPDGLVETVLPQTGNTLLPQGTELQSSLMLTWRAGQHSATAVTHRFDSFEELGNLNLEQFNELVGNLTTLDLQYGYNLKTGKQGEAVFSVGVRNLFDARPQPNQPLPSSAVEQRGRVAYGTIKYQF